MREEDLLEFGKKLKKLRNSKKIELKKIAEQTKININYLKDIEEGNFDFLPELYVKSFLKIYLQQLEEDVPTLIEEYDSIKSNKSDRQLKVTVITDEDLKEIKKPGHFRNQVATIIEKIKPYIRQMNVLWFVVGAIVIFLVIYSLVKDNKNQEIISAGSTGHAFIESVKNTTDTLSSTLYVNNLFNKKSELNLELKALERTWLQISVDDSFAHDHIFDSGMTYGWQAYDKFRLRIGNAAGVRLFLNGKDLGPLGESGEVIKIDLTEKGIQNNSF